MIRPPSKVNEQVRLKGPVGGAHFRLGIVRSLESVGGKLTGRLKVVFPDRDNLESFWLHVVVRGSQDDKRWHTYDGGEQVSCLMDEFDETGVVLGAIYSTVDAPVDGVTSDDDTITYSDGAIVGYNRSTHTATVTLTSGGTINVTVPGGVVNVTVSGGTTNVTADQVNVVSPDVNLGLEPSTKVMLDTIIEKFNTHVHTGVRSGDSQTLPPTIQFIPDVDSAPHVKAF